MIPYLIITALVVGILMYKLGYRFGQTDAFQGIQHYERNLDYDAITDFRRK